MQALPLAALQSNSLKALNGLRDSKEAGGTGEQDRVPHEIVSAPSENNSAPAHPQQFAPQQKAAYRNRSDYSLFEKR